MRKVNLSFFEIFLIAGSNFSRDSEAYRLELDTGRSIKERNFKKKEQILNFLVSDSNLDDVQDIVETVINARISEKRKKENKGKAKQVEFKELTNKKKNGAEDPVLEELMKYTQFCANNNLFTFDYESGVTVSEVEGGKLQRDLSTAATDNYPVDEKEADSEEEDEKEEVQSGMEVDEEGDNHEEDNIIHVDENAIVESPDSTSRKSNVFRDQGTAVM